MPTQGNTKRVTAIPVFDGFRQCRIPRPIGTRTSAFEPIRPQLAKAMGASRSFA